MWPRVKRYQDQNKNTKSCSLKYFLYYLWCWALLPKTVIEHRSRQNLYEEIWYRFRLGWRNAWISVIIWHWLYCWYSNINSSWFYFSFKLTSILKLASQSQDGFNQSVSSDASQTELIWRYVYIYHENDVTCLMKPISKNRCRRINILFCFNYFLIVGHVGGQEWVSIFLSFWYTIW